MDEPEKLKTQINLSIAYIVFLFTLLNTFPDMTTTCYGVQGLGRLDFSFIGFELWKWSLYSLFGFLFSASVQITFSKRYEIWYMLAQILFTLSTILIVAVVFFFIFLFSF